MDSLNKIRQQFVNKNLNTKPCPTCGSSLTTEKTPLFITELCEKCFEHAEIIDVEECCETPQLIDKRFIMANGVSQVRKQCESCGCVQAQAIPGYTSEQRSKLPLIDLDRKQIREKQRTDARCDFFKKAREGKFKIKNSVYEEERENWFVEYNQYLKSTIWLHKRLAVLKRDNYLCQACLDPSVTATEVHHLSYEFVDLKGSEPAYHLVSVCHSCHNNIEEMKRLNRQLKIGN